MDSMDANLPIMYNEGHVFTCTFVFHSMMVFRAEVCSRKLTAMLPTRWLLGHGREQEGRAALEKLVNSADVDKEAADISAQVDADRAARVSIWTALGTPELQAQLHIGDPAIYTLFCLDV